MKAIPLNDTMCLASIKNTDFDAGGDLAYWLKKEALVEQQRKVCRTWIVFDGNDIVGFFSTRLGTHFEDSKGVFLLAKMAVKAELRRKKIGSWILAKVIEHAQAIAEITDFKGIVAQTKKAPDAQRFWQSSPFEEYANGVYLLEEENFAKARDVLLKRFQQYAQSNS